MKKYLKPTSNLHLNAFLFDTVMDYNTSEIVQVTRKYWHKEYNCRQPRISVLSSTLFPQVKTFVFGFVFHLFSLQKREGSSIAFHFYLVHKTDKYSSVSSLTSTWSHHSFQVLLGKAPLSSVFTGGQGYTFFLIRLPDSHSPPNTSIQTAIFLKRGHDIMSMSKVVSSQTYKEWAIGHFSTYGENLHLIWLTD